MNCPAFVFICVVVILAKGTDSITLAERNVIMTLHTYKVSWNKARYICEAENMSLVIDDWLERTNVILFFMEHIWPALVNPWIGLHYGTTATGSETKWVWPDCVIQNLTYYSNWEFLEPQELCVYYNYSDGEWFTDRCNEELEFICEKTVGPCTFEERDGYPDLSLYYQYQTISAANISECQSLCLTEVLSDRNCWAVNLEGANCNLYHTRDPFLFNTISFLSGGSGSSFIKRCYSAATDTINDTPYDNNTNPDPERICEQFSNNRNEEKADLTAALVVTTLPTSTTALSSNTVPPTLAPLTTTVAPTTTSTQASLVSSTALTTSTAITTSSITSPSAGTTAPTTNTAAASAISTSTTVLPVTTDSNVSALPVSQTSTSPLSSPITISTISTISASSSSLVPTVSAISASASIVSSATTTFSATIIISTTTTVSTTQTSPGSAVSSHGTTSTASSPTSTGIFTSTYQSVCTCPCNETRSSNITLVEKLERILTKLRVDKKKLSSTLRKKTCAEDARASAKSVGYVAIVVACVELSVVFIPDLIKFTNFIYFKFIR